MKVKAGCVACLVRQGGTAAGLATDDLALQREVAAKIRRRIHRLSFDAPFPEFVRAVYSTVREMTGVADPYAAAKRETNRRALALLPGLRRRIADSPDPLHAAIRVALIGNIVDLGIGRDFDLEGEVRRILGTNLLTVDDTPIFRKLLKDCHRILYVCDNSGEIAFDCLLVEQLKARCEVVASVKSGPIINDATMEDAEEVGLTSLVKVIETGSDRIGVDWRHVSPEFSKMFQSADIVLAKGQGNFETLDETPGEIFFLLKVKCGEIASALGVSEGATIFLHSRAHRGMRG